MKVTDRQKLEHMESANGAGKSQSVKHKSKVSGKTSEVGESDRVSHSDQMSSAKVKLSDRAQEMKKIRAAVDSTPDTDEAKIAKFKNMIAKGEYKVDPKAVADKMVDEHAYNDFFSGSEE
jgi:flagellar biosynthesis anti-sigma factor FlgM